jgi:glycine cleavage system H lipoate-binding protein
MIAATLIRQRKAKVDVNEPIEGSLTEQNLIVEEVNELIEESIQDEPIEGKPKAKVGKRK